MYNVEAVKHHRSLSQKDIYIDVQYINKIMYSMRDTQINLNLKKLYNNYK